MTILLRLRCGLGYLASASGGAVSGGGADDATELGGQRRDNESVAGHGTFQFVCPAPAREVQDVAMVSSQELAHALRWPPGFTHVQALAIPKAGR